MEIPNAEELLDYVFTPEDYSDDPTTQEYKKLVRVMKVMVNFYKRGERNKKAQHEMVLAELVTINRDLKMVQDQRESLAKFPAYHPKRSHYETELDNEYAEIMRHKERYEAQAKSFNDLHIWGEGIVASVEWLEGNLQHYANQKLGTTFDVEPIRVTAEEYKKYKRGMEEITYNLQESQDFFEASLDGRLRQFHQLEKEMIEAQIEALQKYPAESERRKHVEAELKADLEYVTGNMEENPKIIRHRERMQRMHKDFFAILKWQRKKMIQILDNEPDKIIGDVEQLKQELASQKEEAERQAFTSKFGNKDASEPSNDSCPVPHSQTGAGECPVPHAAKSANGGACPVPHAQAAALLAAKKEEEIRAKKAEGQIHKIYDE